MSWKAIEVLALTRRTSLSTAQLAVLRDLIVYADRESGVAWPSLSTVAEGCGMSVRTARRAVRDLEGFGVLEAVGTRGTKGRITTAYRIVPEALTPDTGSALPRSEDPPTPDTMTGDPGHSDRPPRSEDPPTPDTVSANPSKEPSTEPSKEENARERAPLVLTEDQDPPAQPSPLRQVWDHLRQHEPDRRTTPAKGDGKHISARLAEGYTVADCCALLDWANLSADWYVWDSRAAERRNTGVYTLFKPSGFGDRVQKARRWDQARQRRAPESPPPARPVDDAPAHLDLEAPAPSPEAWRAVLAGMRGAIGRENVRIWLEPAVPSEGPGGRCRLTWQGAFYADWVGEQYAADLTTALQGDPGELHRLLDPPPAHAATGAMP